MATLACRLRSSHLALRSDVGDLDSQRLDGERQRDVVVDITATLSSTVTFAPGEVTKTMSVATSADTTTEGDEYFDVRLSSPTGAVIADGSGRVTITNDDVRGPLPVGLAAAGRVGSRTGGPVNRPGEGELCGHAHPQPTSRPPRAPVSSRPGSVGKDDETRGQPITASTAAARNPLTLPGPSSYTASLCVRKRATSPCALGKTIRV